MSYKFEFEVTKAFGELLETEKNYDVIIHIGEKPDFKEFHAHSIFLSCRSIHFNKILSDKDVKKENEKYVIKKPNITPQAFDDIIKLAIIINHHYHVHHHHHFYHRHYCIHNHHCFLSLSRLLSFSLLLCFYYVLSPFIIILIIMLSSLFFLSYSVIS